VNSQDTKNEMGR